MTDFRKFALVLPPCLALGACNFATFQAAFMQDVVAIETKVAALVAKIQADIPVIEQDVQTAIGLACQLAPLVQQNVANAQSNISNPPSSVQKALNAAANYGAAAASACASYNMTLAAKPTGSTSVNLLVSVWNSYVAGKQALTTALTKVQ